MEERQLLLLRHAKSSWGDAKLGDHERPLNRRGRTAAGLIGQYLKDRGLLPDLILCSTSARTRETLDLAARNWNDEAPPCKYLRDLYHAAPSELLYSIQDVPDEVRRLLIVGHNPGLELLAGQLAGKKSDSRMLGRMREKFPTAALAVFGVPLRRWKSLAAGTARMDAFTLPTDLQTTA